MKGTWLVWYSTPGYGVTYGETEWTFGGIFSTSANADHRANDLEKDATEVLVLYRKAP